MKYRAIVSAVLLVCAMPVPNAAQVPQDLRAAMQARLEAVWKKDGPAWSRLTADEFTVVVPDGTLQTKADRLAALKTEKPEPSHPVQQEQIHSTPTLQSIGLWTAPSGCSRCGSVRTARGPLSRLK